MPRPSRLDHAGAWQHVVNRGARAEALFLSDADRLEFLELLAQAGERHGVEVHAYTLAERHFHLLLRSVRGRLSEAMRQLQQGWSQRQSRVHGAHGPLFQTRFRSRVLVSEGHRLLALEHMHGGLARADLHDQTSSLAWTSLPAYQGAPGPHWLHVEALRALMKDPGVPRRPELRPAPLDALTPPWPTREAAPPQAPDLADADRQPMPVLAAIHALTGADLPALQRGERGPLANPARRFAVWALRRHTDLSQAEVAGLLAMSTRQVQNVELRLRRAPGEPVSTWISQWEAERPLRSPRG